MSPGDIVLVKFPFTSLETVKKRPALLLRVTRLSSKETLSTIAMITSKLDGLELEGDVILSEWQKAKLLHPSLVRLAKIATLDSGLVERKLGRLSAADHAEVSKSFARLYSYWIR